jgi:hypothetical protein
VTTPSSCANKTHHFVLWLKSRRQHQSGELSQRFIEFVMMHAQNAALFLGQIPNPQTGKGEVQSRAGENVHRSVIDIQEKTRGNLTTDEATVLKNTLSNLQMIYFEVARSPQGAASRPPFRTGA